MTVDELDQGMVDLVPDQLIMKQDTDMTMYTITDRKIVHIDEHNPEDGIQMVVVLKRKIQNEILTTYLPTILLVLITLSTILYKPAHFEAAVSVNLTIMLVMTTIFTGVSESLPQTAYLKLIDAWLIFGQLIPFIEVILLTVLEAIREGDENRSDQSPYFLLILTQP